MDFFRAKGALAFSQELGYLVCVYLSLLFEFKDGGTKSQGQGNVLGPLFLLDVRQKVGEKGDDGESDE